MKITLCPDCQTMIAKGVDVAPLVGEQFGGSMPIEAENLEVFAPGSGHSTNVQIRRCRDCGALYRYRHHSEYDVSGSWDEYYFWQMSATAQGVIGEILASAGGYDCALHAAALHNADADVREDAALLLWIFVDQGHPVDASLLAAACEALADTTFLVGNYCYRALLSYGYRGKESANLLLEILAKAQITHPETKFGWILVKEFA